MPLRGLRREGRLPGGARRLILGEDVHRGGPMAQFLGDVVFAGIYSPSAQTSSIWMMPTRNA
jgi:hypothetical protein